MAHIEERVPQNGLLLISSAMPFPRTLGQTSNSLFANNAVPFKMRVLHQFFLPSSKKEKTNHDWLPLQEPHISLIMCLYSMCYIIHLLLIHTVSPWLWAFSLNPDHLSCLLTFNLCLRPLR